MDGDHPWGLCRASGTSASDVTDREWALIGRAPRAANKAAGRARPASDSCPGRERRVPQHRQVRQIGRGALDDLVRPLIAKRGWCDDKPVAEDVDGHARVGPDVAALGSSLVPCLEIAAARAHDKRRIAVSAQHICKNAFPRGVHIDNDDPRRLRGKPESGRVGKTLDETAAAYGVQPQVVADGRRLAVSGKVAMPRSA